MLSEIVIILRVSGILFCLLHANSFYASQQQLNFERASTIRIISQIGDNSLLLFSGALLILLSLKLQEGLQLEGDSGEAASWPLPAFYPLTRPFLLLLAGLYLAITPVTVLQYQTIRNGLVRPIDQAYIRQQNQINDLDTLADKKISIEELSEKLDAFIQEHKFNKLNNIVLPNSISEAKIFIPQLRSRSEGRRNRKIGEVTRQTRVATNKLILESLIESALWVFYWFNWPRRSVGVVRQARDSMRKGIL